MTSFRDRDDDWIKIKEFFFFLGIFLFVKYIVFFAWVVSRQCHNEYELIIIIILLNRILKILIKKLFSFLTNLFRACVEHDYHSRCFREVNIIIMKKWNKNNYTDFKTYKFIALLNMIDKTFEFIIVRKVNTFTKIHEMLFATQMKKRRKRICETTLKFFIEQIHMIWNMSKNKMITLLSINVTNAYNHVSRERFMHNLRKIKISD